VNLGGSVVTLGGRLQTPSSGIEPSDGVVTLSAVAAFTAQRVNDRPKEGHMRNHFIWRAVGQNYEALKKHAPVGTEPLVEVHVLGNPAPIPTVYVETHRQQPWVVLHSIIEGRNDSDKFYATDRYVFVHEDRIDRTEIRFVRAHQVPTGFAVVEAEIEADEPMVAFA
jgi:hypothetical protein